MRHKKRCSIGALYCTKCPSFSINLEDDLYYHIAKKQSTAGLKNHQTCEECNIEFPNVLFPETQQTTLNVTTEQKRLADLARGLNEGQYEKFFSGNINL